VGILELNEGDCGPTERSSVGMDGSGGGWAAMVEDEEERNEGCLPCTAGYRNMN
jgi:hypothetical protein